MLRLPAPGEPSPAGCPWPCAPRCPPVEGAPRRASAARRRHHHRQQQQQQHEDPPGPRPRPALQRRALEGSRSPAALRREPARQVRRPRDGTGRGNRRPPQRAFPRCLLASRDGCARAARSSSGGAAGALSPGRAPPRGQSNRSSRARLLRSQRGSLPGEVRLGLQPSGAPPRVQEGVTCRHPVGMSVGWRFRSPGWLELRGPPAWVRIPTPWPEACSIVPRG